MSYPFTYFSNKWYNNDKTGYCSNILITIHINYCIYYYVTTAITFARWQWPAASTDHEGTSKTSVGGGTSTVPDTWLPICNGDFPLMERESMLESKPLPDGIIIDGRSFSRLKWAQPSYGVWKSSNPG